MIEITLPSYYRVQGGWRFLIAFILLSLFVGTAEPDFWTMMQRQSDENTLLIFLLIDLLFLIDGGLRLLYGQLKFQLQQDQMVVLWWKLPVLHVAHERMTAVRYRENWLQLHWQGRGAWLSYLFCLPSSKANDYKTYQKWLPILQKNISQLYNDAPERVELYLRTSFVFAWLMLGMVFQLIGWGSLISYATGYSRVEGGLETFGLLAIACLIIGCGFFGFYYLFRLTGSRYTMTAQKIAVRYGFKKVVHATAVAPRIERKHRVYTRKGRKTRVDLLIIYLPDRQKIRLDSTQVRYSYLSQKADFDLLAHHLQKMYESNY